jgi:hypothetical protein
VCLFASILFLGPRAGIIVYWLGWPAAWKQAYAHFWVPLIGFFVFPWTTLMYAIVAPSGVHSWDYFWLGLAILIDVASLASQGGAGRARMGASTQPQPGVI